MQLLEAIFQRRDTRHFSSEKIDLQKIREAIAIADRAPSVGQSKPTRYVLVDSTELREAVKQNFLQTNAQARQQIADEKLLSAYDKLKLEGIMEAPVGLVICCDFSVLDNFTLGTVSQPREMLLASSACAVHTMWLYLTSIGLGMGWVSILDYKLLGQQLQLDKNWWPLGYFCIGKPADDYDKMPMLSQQKWNSHLQAPIIIQR